MRFVIFVSVVIILACFGCRENTVDTGGKNGMKFLSAEDVDVTDVYTKD